MQEVTHPWSWLATLDGCCAFFSGATLEFLRQPSCKDPRYCQCIALSVVFLMFCAAIPSLRPASATLLAFGFLAAFVYYAVLFILALATGALKLQSCLRRDYATCFFLVLVLGICGLAFAIGGIEAAREGLPLGLGAWVDALPTLSIEGTDPTETMLLLILACAVVPLIWHCCRCAAQSAGVQIEDGPAHKERGRQRDPAAVCV